ncbi:hypothetical protein TKK_0001694 [Trichogramma kaykai]
MFKTTISCFDNIKLNEYKKLITLLKKKNKGYLRKKSATFTKENVSKLLNEAPNNQYLGAKVFMIFSISGAVRRLEFINLLKKEVKEYDDVMVIDINNTKNDVLRSFTINGPLMDICKKYINLRPITCSTDRFFIRYGKGFCYNQPIGINTFASMPKVIANYLQLPNSGEFTGHSFRRTSATLLVDAGVDITTLKRLGEWKSDAVAFGYIAGSISNKKDIFKKISSGIILNSNENLPQTTTTINQPSTSAQPVQQSKRQKVNH